MYDPCVLNLQLFLRTHIQAGMYECASVCREMPVQPVCTGQGSRSAVPVVGERRIGAQDRVGHRGGQHLCGRQTAEQKFPYRP